MLGSSTQTRLDSLDQFSLGKSSLPDATVSHRIDERQQLIERAVFHGRHRNGLVEGFERHTAVPTLRKGPDGRQVGVTLDLSVQGWCRIGRENPSGDVAAARWKHILDAVAPGTP